MRHNRQIASFLVCIFLSLSAASCSSFLHSPAAASLLATPEQTAGFNGPPATTGVDCPTPDQQVFMCDPLSAGATTSPAAAAGPVLDRIPPGPAAAPLTSTPLRVIPPTGTPIASPTSSPPCDEQVCVYPGEFLLARPIIPPRRDTIDVTYRFGTTQGGTRDPHHGVEFLNSSGTPVLAAADGVVEVAGDDRETIYGLYSYFYGNLVILKHTFPDLDQPLYSLYGHLSQISVAVGDQVRSGQEIGRVGMTGVATGSHLHFEVRLDENSYQSSRNPELWLTPHKSEDGRPMGALAGRILDAQGSYVSIPNIVIGHLPAPGQAADYKLYLGTYEDKALIGQAPWKENFAIGDLPAGWYRISFVQFGMQQQVIQILPGQLTLVTFRLGG